MEVGSVVGSIDVAQVTLYVFWVFFACLIWYLRQEDRREGYPLEDDVTGRFNKNGFLFVPPAKTFHLPHGHGTVSVPNDKRDDRPLAAERASVYPGSPLLPTGNPMLDGVGPGSWAERSDRPDADAHGRPILAPMRAAGDFSVVEGDTDPRGLRVVGCDKVTGGTVTDIWVDRAEHLARYLEVQVDAGGAIRSIMVPMNFCVIKTGRGKERYVYVNAITGAQFADVPAIASDGQMTLLEEERIVAYFGGGQLYATPRRQEPLL